MAVEKSSKTNDNHSGTSAGWLLLLITLFILLIVNTILAIILLNKMGSDDIKGMLYEAAQATRPTLLTRPLLAAAGVEPTSILPEPTQTPSHTLHATDAFSELPVLVASPGPIIPTATPLPQSETTLPATPLLTQSETPPSTATAVPPTETPLPAVTPYTAEIPDDSPMEASWHGVYYANILFAGTPVLVRDHDELAFNWGNSAPVEGVPADRFSARWERTLQLDAGVYQFYVHGDDGVRVWVDNLLLINEWHGATDVTYKGQVTLRGGKHKIKVEYFEDEGTAGIQFWWDGPGSYTDWCGEYWSNRDLSGEPTLVRNDEVIDFNWERNEPDDDLPRDEFSARWTRLAIFEEGIYRFHAKVDDGLRLFIDNKLVIYEWRDGGERQVSATQWLSGGAHYITAEYYEHTGVATIHLWWEKE